jgi:hypothetical protein
MTYGMQHAIPAPEWKWQKDNGSLDMDALLKEFQDFWCENADIWEVQTGYTEAFPHLLLMSFLQRIINGGGTIDREYAAGRGRVDLYVEFNGFKYIIEIKMWRSNQIYDIVLKKGLTQIKRYRTLVASNAPAYLVIFDRRNSEDKAPWNERLTWQNIEDITVVGG